MVFLGRQLSWLARLEERWYERQRREYLGIMRKYPSTEVQGDSNLTTDLRIVMQIEQPQGDLGPDLAGEYAIASRALVAARLARRRVAPAEANEVARCIPLSERG